MNLFDGDKLLNLIEHKMNYLPINFMIHLIQLIKLSKIEYQSFEKFSWLEGREVLTRDKNDLLSLATCVMQDDNDLLYDNNMCLFFKDSAETLSIDDPVLRDYVWIKTP